MTRKVFNVEGGKHSSAAFAAFENRAYGSVVASPASFVVSAGTGMNVSISPGDAIISVDANTAKRVQSDATETVAVSSASTSFNRIDTVVGYFDTGVAATQSVIDNTNNMFKFAVVAGTAASTPVAPTGAAIQSAIGAGNSYMVLYDVTVPSNATNLTAATFTDRRKILTVVDGTNLKDGSVTNQKLASASVKPENISNPYKFSVFRNAAVNSNTSPAIIPFDTKLFDNNNNYNTSTYKYTAPVTGYYWFAAAAGNTLAAGAPMNTRIVTSAGQEIVGTTISSPNAGTISEVTGLLYLVAGQTVEARYMGGGGSVMYVGQSQCYFMGFIVSTT